MLSPDRSDPDASGFAPLGPSAPLSSVWATRRARALQLADERPQAAELLLTYAELVQVQGRVAEAVPSTRWLALVGAEGGPPRLRLDRLPLEELVPLLADFLAGAGDLGTEIMRTSAGTLSSAPGASWLALLGTALTPDGTAEEAPFHIRAFLQPVATALAGSDPRPLETAKGGRCLVCGGAPAVGAIQDLRDGAGSRGLICAICGTSWRLPRIACAYCGEDDADRLVAHKAPSAPWVRIDECQRCGRYLKSVDLREEPEAVPLVDDLATADLDSWARARGLRRPRESLFGF